MGRILALDVGERRIGIAISTPEGGLATPLRVLERQGDAADAQAIADLARSEKVESLVVGNPLSLDGSTGSQARRVQDFARRVAEVCGLHLEFWDERLTSVQARRAPGSSRRSARKGGRRRRAPDDDLAAAIILQSYLDRHRPASPPLSES